jgi:hypothetical protein
MTKRVSLSSELQLLLESARGIYALNCRFIESFGMETDLPESMYPLRGARLGESGLTP